MEICILNLIKIQFDHKMFQNSHPSWFNRLSLPKTYLLVLIKCVSTWLAPFDCTVDICKRDNQKEVKSETWLFRVFFMLVLFYLIHSIISFHTQSIHPGFYHGLTPYLFPHSLSKPHQFAGLPSVLWSLAILFFKRWAIL